ncbi:MAG: phage shock protein PspA [Parvularculaceae bacterium]
MGVFSRLSDIINSNLNAMLDRAEDPEKIVRLIIQEMEDTLVEVRTAAARAIADKKEILRKLDHFEQRQEEWRAKAELAVSKGRDDLAKGALAARRKAQEMAEILTRELALVEESVDKANADLEQLQSKLQEAKAKEKALQLRRQSANDRVRVTRHIYDGRIDEAVARYENFERKIDELEAEAEAIAMGRPRSLSEQFAELESEESVNAELKRLKERLAARGADQ